MHSDILVFTPQQHTIHVVVSCIFHNLGSLIFTVALSSLSVISCLICYEVTSQITWMLLWVNETEIHTMGAFMLVRGREEIQDCVSRSKYLSYSLRPKSSFAHSWFFLTIPGRKASVTVSYHKTDDIILAYLLLLLFLCLYRFFPFLCVEIPIDTPFRSRVCVVTNSCSCRLGHSINGLSSP